MTLERKLEANKEKKRRDRPSMKRIWGQLADPGCDASYNAVCRYATAWKRRHGAGVSGAHFPLVFDPAEAIKPDLEGRAGDLPLVFLSRTTVARDQMSAEELDALQSEAFRFSGVGALER